MTDKKRILVLGAGLMGRWVARYMAENGNNAVLVYDKDESALEHVLKSTPHKIGVSNVDFIKDIPFIQNRAAEQDIVIGAMPCAVSFPVLDAVLETETDVVDISFYEDSPNLLGDIASGSLYVPHMGVDPGLNRFLLGHELSQFESIEYFETRAGGLPAPATGKDYLSVFEVGSVVDEYTRDVVVVRDGKIITLPALSEARRFHHKYLGFVESFNTNNLRGAEMYKGIVRNMRTQTIRYVGHRDRFLKLIEDKKPSDNDWEEILKKIAEEWRWEQGDHDVLAMDVDFIGIKNGKKIKTSYSLFVEYDDDTGATAMAQATCLPLSAVAEWILNTDARKLGHTDARMVGLVTPEFLGNDRDCFKFVMKYLKKHCITLEKYETEV